MQRDELNRVLAELLETARFQDYCPNGLQVEGRPTIHKIVTGVTASLALLEAAVAAQADAILVHHGYFWKGEDPRVIQTKHARLSLLLKNEINLFAYHLPLDSHPTLGNNAQLALRLGLQADGRFGESAIGWVGTQAATTNADELIARIAQSLGRPPVAVGNLQRSLRRIAWCTGAAQGYLQAALDAGADCYISGEISEHTVHLAREAGVVYIAAGHHATERYGIQAVGEHLAQMYGLSHEFIEIDNPV